MKTITQLSLVLMLTVTLTTRAQKYEQLPTVKILPHQVHNELRVMYVGSEAAALKIEIRGQGKTITRDYIKAGSFDKGFIRLYDVSRLNDGEYTLLVNAGDFEAEHTFTVAADQHLWAQYWHEALNQHLDKSQVAALDTMYKESGQ